MPMKIYYDHRLGKIERTDWQYTRVLAEDVSAEEESAALDMGFVLLTDLPVPLWENLRSTRIDMARHGEPSAPLMTGVHHRQNALPLASYVDLYDRFIAARGFTPIETDLEFTARDSVIEYERDGALIGFSKVRHYQGAVELQLHCHVLDDKSFSYRTLTHELALFGDSVPFIYLGPGYEMSSIYKARVPGFEWWTGRLWSRDTAEYVSRCKQDSAFVP